MYQMFQAIRDFMLNTSVRKGFDTFHFSYIGISYSAFQLYWDVMLNISGHQ
jgi:hypothetical protein